MLLGRPTPPGDELQNSSYKYIVVILIYSANIIINTLTHPKKTTIPCQRAVQNQRRNSLLLIIRFYKYSFQLIEDKPSATEHLANSPVKHWIPHQLVLAQVLLKEGKDKDGGGRPGDVVECEVDAVVEGLYGEVVVEAVEEDA